MAPKKAVNNTKPTGSKANQQTSLTSRASRSQGKPQKPRDKSQGEKGKSTESKKPVQMNKSKSVTSHASQSSSKVGFQKRIQPGIQKYHIPPETSRSKSQPKKDKIEKETVKAPVKPN